jgi:oligoendopeptidase F
MQSIKSANATADYPARVIERKSHFEALSDRLRRNLDTCLDRSNKAVNTIIDNAKARAEMYEEYARRTAADMENEKESLDRVGS